MCSNLPPGQVPEDIKITSISRPEYTAEQASDSCASCHSKGMPITGIEDAEAIEDVSVVHAGTTLEDGRLVTSGGRILSVIAMGDDVQTAGKRVYEALEKIHIPNCHYRTDIGTRGVS